SGSGVSQLCQVILQFWRRGGTLVVSVLTCPSPVAGADVATKASRAVVPGSGGRSGRDRRPYASPRGGAAVGRDLTAADRVGWAARPEHDGAAGLLTPAGDGAGGRGRPAKNRRGRWVSDPRRRLSQLGIQVLWVRRGGGVELATT